MYTLKYDARVLHDTRFDDEVLASGTCTLDINSAGSLNVSVPPTHPLYNTLALMSAEHEVVLLDDEEEVFRGRVTGDGTDINGVQSITVEGHLAYLNDSVVAPYGTYESTPDDDGVREWEVIAPSNRHEYAEWLISQHNAQTDAAKQYRIGVNDLPDAPITRSSTQWPSTKAEITDKLIDEFGCVMSAYMLGGVRYVDFKADGGKDATQAIEFGYNLLDFARTSRAVDAITCIVPTGKDAGSKEFGLAALPDGPVGDGMTKQGDRILHEAGVTSCGIIVARKSYDVATLDGLVNACCSDLAASQLAVDSIEISATDLHDLDPSIERIRLGEWVFVSARPLKFEARMMCVSIDIDVSNPGATKYVLGAELPTLTNGNKATAARIRKQESAIIERMRPIDQTAKDAVIKADTASSTASEAKTTATNASTTAAKASSVASAAEAKAATAQDTALAASTKADTANSAAVTAQAAASTANTNAATAQTTATNAATAAAAAAKTATDYMDFGTDGLTIGDMTSGALAGNVRIASDGIELRDGTSVLARLKAGVLELAANSVNAIIKLCGGKGIIAYYAGTDQLAIMAPGSIAMTACQTLPDGTVQPYDAGIACNQYGVVAKGVVEISGSLRSLGREGNITDWVVAEGTSGGWYWRKWASGVAECFGTFSSTFSVTTAFGGVYYGSLPRVAYPFVFSSVINEVVNVYGGNFWPGVYGSSTTSTPSGYVYSAGSYANQNQWISYNTVGRWK